MSVIAWDGKSIAADRQATNADCAVETRKLRVSSTQVGIILAWTGNQEMGQMLAQWWDNGAKPEHWPDFQRDDNKWCRLIVASKNGIVTYEQQPVGVKVFGPFMAWGVGRDFALGAMAMGADAKKGRGGCVSVLGILRDGN